MKPLTRKDKKRNTKLTCLLLHNISHLTQRQLTLAMLDRFTKLCKLNLSEGVRMSRSSERGHLRMKPLLAYQLSTRCCLSRPAIAEKSMRSETERYY